MKVFSTRLFTSSKNGKTYKIGVIILPDGSIVDAFVPLDTVEGDEVQAVLYGKDHKPAVRFEKA